MISSHPNGPNTLLEKNLKLVKNDVHSKLEGNLKLVKNDIHSKRVHSAYTVVVDGFSKGALSHVMSDETTSVLKGSLGPLLHDVGKFIDKEVGEFLSGAVHDITREQLLDAQIKHVLIGAESVAKALIPMWSADRLSRYRLSRYRLSRYRLSRYRLSRYRLSRLLNNITVSVILFHHACIPNHRGIKYPDKNTVLEYFTAKKFGKYIRNDISRIHGYVDRLSKIDNDKDLKNLADEAIRSKYRKRYFLSALSAYICNIVDQLEGMISSENRLYKTHNKTSNYSLEDAKKEFLDKDKGRKFPETIAKIVEDLQPEDFLPREWE